MINGAVSHELRNPLNSMIGQISSMQDFFTNFRMVIEQLQINGIE
jgi:CheY-like chemotaxis protein